MFMEKSSVFKRCNFLVLLAACAMFWACSDDKSVAGGSTEDAGIIAIKNLDVAGLTQKGPFVKGSAVTVQGIDCKTLKLTDEHFEGSVKSDKGDFTVKEVSLKSTCALFEVTGIYRSEITGKKSSKELTLHALTDLKDRENVNINVLTELEYERLLHLVTEKGKKFAEAKEQAEKEVLAAFDIAGSFEAFENLNIFEAGDENAALLAVSVMMQAETDDAGLAKRIEKFEDSFAESGKWKDSDTKKVISEWAVEASANGKLDSIRKNVEAWNDGDKVATFEKFIEAYADGDSIVLSSSSFRSSSSTEPALSSAGEIEDLSGSSSSSDNTTNSCAGVESSSSATSSSASDLVSSGEESSSSVGEFDWSIPKEAYLNPDISYGEITDARDGQVYKTVKIGNQTWMAENLNYADSVKTPSLLGHSWCHDNDPKKCKVAGRLYDWAAAIDTEKLYDDGDGIDCGIGAYCEVPDNTQGICPDGWHLPKSAEWKTLLAAAGTENLKSQWGWLDDEAGTDSVGFSAVAYGCRKKSTGLNRDVGEEAYFWSATDDSEVHAYSYRMSRGVKSDYKDYGFSIRCVKNEAGVISSSSSIASSSSVMLATLCKTETEDNCEYGTLTDSRDGRTYKTVVIGAQTWMAENLNFETDDSECYDNDASNCEKYGRLYSWGTAMDGAGAFSENGKGCGNANTCLETFPVRGICPSGWHLPDKYEWETLFIAARGYTRAGRILKSRSGWGDGGNGEDAVGFTVLFDGLGASVDDSRAYFWTSTETSGEVAYWIGFRGVNDYVTNLENDKDNFAYVRCLKDE